MENSGPFKSWVPNGLVVFTLVCCMLHSMILLGVYTSNVTYAASFLDVEPEDLQYALCVTYGTFLATLLVEARLFRFFPTRAYFLSIYALAAICFVLSVRTNNFALFILLRIAEGILMALPWLPLRQLLLSRFRSRNATIIAFTLNYATLLLASPFIMNIVVWLLDHYDWSYMAYGSALMQLLCLGLIRLTFNRERLQRKFPLYQIDWASFILLAGSILLLSFVLIYGEKRYWFQDMSLRWAALSGVSAGLLFLFRQHQLKRPVFRLETFTFPKLLAGFFLFLLFYISRATLNMVHQTFFTVWNWDPYRVAGVQLYNVCGNALGMALAAWLLARKTSWALIFVIGFGGLAVSHFWFTGLFYPDTALSEILVPYIMQGIGVGVLLVPLVLYTLASVPEPFAPYAGTTGVAGRFWGSTLGFCLFQNLLAVLRNIHYQRLSASLAPDSPQAQSRLAQTTESFLRKGFTDDQARQLALRQLNDSLLRQTQLLSQMEIFTWTGWVLLVLCLILLWFHFRDRQQAVLRNGLWGS